MHTCQHRGIRDRHNLALAFSGISSCGHLCLWGRRCFSRKTMWNIWNLWQFTEWDKTVPCTQNRTWKYTFSEVFSLYISNFRLWFYSQILIFLEKLRKRINKSKSIRWWNIMFKGMKGYDYNIFILDHFQPGNVCDTQAGDLKTMMKVSLAFFGLISRAKHFPQPRNEGHAIQVSMLFHIIAGWVISEKLFQAFPTYHLSDSNYRGKYYIFLVLLYIRKCNKNLGSSVSNSLSFFSIL